MIRRAQRARRTGAQTAGLAALVLAAACAPDGVQAAGSEPWFRDAAEERGLTFRHASGHEERYLFPEIMGGGVALADLDRDGDLDAYLVQSGSLNDPPEARPGNRLYRNRGDGHFDDATAGSGADDPGYGMGVAVADADGDGDRDLYVTNVGPNALLANNGNGTFEPATARSGTGDPAWSISAAFLDHDLDGDLDLFVTNYVLWSVADERACELAPLGPDYCSPKVYESAPDTLYRNEGDGSFVDVSSVANLRSSFGNGLGVLTADFDADGLVDVFVANDGTLNQLWKNRGDGTFEDVALYAGCAVDDHGVAKAGMGVAAADLDDDGDEDLLVCNLEKESDSLYLNQDGVFRDRTARQGLALTSRPFTRFGCAFVDFDQDGWLDLYVANGRVTRSPRPFGTDPFAEPNLGFRGSAEGFRELEPRGGTAAPLIATSRGAAFGDVDGDGDVDLLIGNRDAPPHLLLNQAARGGWIRFRALEQGGGDALGAVVRARVGPRVMTRRVRSASSYGSASEPAVHLGLGGASGVEGVVVTWPGGDEEAFGDFPAGSSVDLVRGRGRALAR